MSNESPSPLCWQHILINNTGSDDGVGGIRSSIIVTIEDTCPSCNKTHLDLSVGAWNRLTENAAFGTVDISWHVLRFTTRQDYN
jgi:expansin (peptidoglycan-binding protein)